MTVFFRFIAVSIITISVFTLNDSAFSKTHRYTHPNINVLASTSLIDVLSEIAQRYSIENDTSISLTFRDPVALLESVENGEPADLFISEHPDVIKELKQKGLIDVQSLSLVGRNHLVLATPVNSHMEKKFGTKTNINKLVENISEHTLLSIGDTDITPLGILSKHALQTLNHWDDVSPYVIPAASAQQALKMVEQETASAGIMYHSDAFQNDYLTTLGTFPRNSYEPIYYRAAVVAGKNMEHARVFLQHLKSAKAKKMFASKGFRAN